VAGGLGIWTSEVQIMPRPPATTRVTWEICMTVATGGTPSREMLVTPADHNPEPVYGWRYRVTVNIHWSMPHCSQQTCPSRFLGLATAVTVDTPRLQWILQRAALQALY